MDVQSKLRDEELRVRRRRQRKVQRRLAQGRREWSTAVANARRTGIVDPASVTDANVDGWATYPWCDCPGIDWAMMFYPGFDWENTDYPPWIPRYLWEQQTGTAEAWYAWVEGTEPREYIPPLDVQELWTEIHCVKLNIDACRSRLRKAGLPDDQEVIKEHSIGRSVKGDKERRILAQLKTQYGKTRELLETELLRWHLRPSRLARLADKVGNLFARLYGCHSCVDKAVDLAGEFGGFQTKVPVSSGAWFSRSGFGLTTEDQDVEMEGNWAGEDAEEYKGEEYTSQDVENKDSEGKEADDGEGRRGETPWRKA